MNILTQHEKPKEILWTVSKLPIGKALIGTTPQNALARVGLLHGKEPSELVAEWQAHWTRTYFSPHSSLRNLEGLSLLLIGTDFQIKTWKAIMQVPPGTVASYGDIARRIGSPRAMRAVGTACSVSCLTYFVPCHRIVSAKGLGGYGGKLDWKRALLKAEGYSF